MTWQIDLFGVRSGEDPCKVRDVQYEWEEHDGSSVVEDASAETDRWIELAMGLLQGVSPGFKLVEEDGEWSLSFDDHGHIRHLRIGQPDEAAQQDQAQSTGRRLPHDAQTALDVLRALANGTGASVEKWRASVYEAFSGRENVN